MIVDAMTRREFFELTASRRKRAEILFIDIKHILSVNLVVLFFLGLIRLEECKEGVCTSPHRLRRGRGGLRAGGDRLDGIIGRELRGEVRGESRSLGCRRN